MTQQNDKELTRREMLRRSAKAAIAIAAAGIVSRALYDPKGPADRDPQDQISLPDFAVPHAPGNTISIVRGPDRTNSLNRAINLLGGIQRFVKPRERVLIKPNVAFASPPIIGATTHPDLVAELVRLCYSKASARMVLVADNPINDPSSCFINTGIAKAAQDAGANIILPREDSFKPTTLKDGKLIRNWPFFAQPFKNIDKVIGVAPVKHHLRSGASMTMKNWYGLLGGRRNIFHQNINTIIAELARLVSPTLVILDGTEVMISNGPTGGSVSDLRRLNTIIASCDQVAADAFGATLLDLALAQVANVGKTDYQSLKPLVAEF